MATTTPDVINPANRPFLILKIGGSLVSDKRRHRHVDQDAIRGFARLVAELHRRAPGGVVLVVGGGSFGHGAVRHLDPSDPFGALKLTEAAFAQKWIWTEALRSEGALALPLQLAAMCVVDGDKVVFNGDVTRRVLSLGFLPVLSGDCLVATDGTLRVYGSDNVSQILLSLATAPVRVVVLTDVPGIISSSVGFPVLQQVDPDHPQEALDSLWQASDHDTTRGMEGKLMALIDCARRGADCAVMKGDPAAESLTFLLEEPENWPATITFTRIKRPD